MYELFNRAYVRDIFKDNNFLLEEKIDPLSGSIGNPEFQELLKRYEGASFNKGSYRIVRYRDIPHWIDCIASIFPEYSKRIVPFGYDWLGRFFCLDIESIANSKSLVLLFSGFTNEAMEIPVNIVEFHNKVLIEQSDAALEVGKFSNFLDSSKIMCLSITDCVDMVVPLYMKGTYSVSNMKLADLTMSWEINAQLLSQLKTVQEGTIIKSVTVV